MRGALQRSIQGLADLLRKMTALGVCVCVYSELLNEEGLGEDMETSNLYQGVSRLLFGARGLLSGGDKNYTTLVPVGCYQGVITPL